MTCASCASRVERGLNEVDGVTATVNFATERAAVEYDPARVAPEQLLGAVADAGYSCAAGRRLGADDDDADGVAPPPASAISAALSLPVLLLSMVSALQFDGWEWLALGLATPVVLWGAWPFHRATWTHLKHRAATMDTLISIGVLAAWLWSLYAVVAGDARHLPRDRLRDHHVRSWPAATPRRARSAAPAPRSRRCSSWAPRTWRSSTRTAPSAACRSRSSSRAAASWCAPARGWPRTAWSRRAPRRST